MEMAERHGEGKIHRGKETVEAKNKLGKMGRLPKTWFVMILDPGKIWNDFPPMRGKHFPGGKAFIILRNHQSE